MLNKICLIGNVGHTPDIKMVGESKVANFSLGVTKRGYTKKDGSRVEDKTEWFNCQTWRGQADVIEKYVKKGDKLYVEGEMTSRKYSKDGVEKTVWEVIVANIELLTPKGSIANASVADSPVPPQAQQAPAMEGADDLPF